ncbi:MAG: DNA-binding MarR family transcriptional regulator [Candidatus Arcticimaribacter sp.]|jgi:DNA-binding MarR family transcriptional regulator
MLFIQYMSQQITRNSVISILTSGYQVNDELSSLFKVYGISLPQFNVLRILRGQNGTAANLSTIQERMIHKMSNTTRLIDKLIDKGYVNRFVCEKNRRKIELFITDQGLKLLKSLDRISDNKEKRLLKNLNIKEKEELIRILSKIKTEKSQ